MNCVWTLVHLHYTSQFHTFQGNHQNLQWNVCAAHVNNFSSNLVECVDFSDFEWRYCGLVYKFFRINNIELKCSFVRCGKYHKSYGAAEHHISVDLLCGTTDVELHNSINLLCGTTAAELTTRFDACTRSRTHFLKTVTNHDEKYEGLIQSKILVLRVFYFSKRLKERRRHKNQYVS